MHRLTLPVRERECLLCKDVSQLYHRHVTVFNVEHDREDKGRIASQKMASFQVDIKLPALQLLLNVTY